MAYIIPYIPYIVAAIGAVSAAKKGQDAKAAADYNAKVAETNASNVNAQATARQELQGSSARHVVGEQLAVGAESGLGLSGSRLDVLNQSLWNAEMDALNIRYEGNVQAQGLNSQAKLDRFSGKSSETAGYLSAVSSLASAASSYTSAGGTVPYSYGTGPMRAYGNH